MIKKTYLEKVKLALLCSSGVEDWEYYDSAISDFQNQIAEYNDMDVEDIEMDDENILIALDNAGVQSWEFYDEALEGYEAYESYVMKLNDVDFNSGNFRSFIEFESENEG